MTLSSLARLLLCVLLCLGAGAIGGLVTYPQIPTWYAGLVKPSWTPPSWVFPVVWNILYLMMAVSLWLLWSAREPNWNSGPNSGPSGSRGRAIALFLVQLALNVAWSPVFFAFHQTRAALAIIALLALAVAATIATGWRVDRRAAGLLIPYLAWIAYAATLNAGIVLLNP